MNSYKQCFACLCLFVSCTALYSQAVYDPYHHYALPNTAPQWMKAIEENPRGVNFFKMDSLYNDWLSKDWAAKIKTRAQKPAVNYFRRWRKAYAPYVGVDGFIHLPSLYQYNRAVEAYNKSLLSKRGKLKSLSENTIWHNIGPNQTRSITNTKDSQACVFRIAASKSNPNIVYSGAETGVVFRTENKGRQWKACNGAFDFGSSITALAVNPKNPDVVYVGSDLGLWKSEDGGQHWSRVGKNNILTRVNSIKINLNNPTHISVATEQQKDRDKVLADGGLYVSTNGGKTFEQRFSGFAYDHELKPNDAHTIYLLARKTGDNSTRLFISTDEGENFIAKDLLEDVRLNAGRLAVSDAPSGENYLYALVTEDAGYDNQGGVGRPHIMQSKDSGQSWEDKTIRADNNSWSGKGSFFDIDERNGGQGYFDMMIGVSNKDPETVIFGLCNLYRSTTGGSGGWGRFYGGTGIGGYVALENMHPDMQDICVNGEDTWVCNDGGIKYSNNFFETPGESRMNGFYAADYHGFDVGWNEDVMVGGRWHNGDAVHALSYGQGNTIHVGGVEQATGYVYLDNPYRVYFSDAAAFLMPKNWDGSVEPIYGTYFSQLTPYEVLKSNGRLVFDPRYAMRLLTVGKENNVNNQSGYGILYQSLDNGKSFKACLDTEGDMIYSYEFARSNPNVIYVATALDFYRSLDNGKSWHKMTFPFANRAYGNTWKVAIDPLNEQKVWAVSIFEPNGIRMSEDGGHTWKNIDYTGLGNRKIGSIVLTGDEKDGVYVGTTEGTMIFYRDKSMPQWEPYTSGLNPSARLTRLLPFYKTGVLRLATNQGIWEAPLKNQHFRPIAQPIALNVGSGVVSPQQVVQLDSYSIVKQDKDTKFEWTISPQPQHIDNRLKRNPQVVFGKAGAYDITLKVTNSQGLSHSRTIHKMIIVGHDVSNNDIVPGSGYDNPNDRNDDVTTGIQEVSAGLYPNVILQGEKLVLKTKNLPEPKRVTIYDVKGHLLHEYHLTKDQHEQTIDVSDLPKGPYIYEIMGITFKSFGKILIQ